MNLNWQIDGAYATWRLAITTEPAREGENDEPVPGTAHLDDWRVEPLALVFRHFRHVVELLENGRRIEELEGISTR